MGADFHIGLDEKDFHRVSNVVYPTEEITDQLKELTKSLAKYRISGKVAMKTFMNPNPDDNSAWKDWWRKAEVPAANGHGNARSVATIQGLITNGGEINGVRLLKPETIDLIFKEQSLTAARPPKYFERLSICRIFESCCIDNYTLFNLFKILLIDFSRDLK